MPGLIRGVARTAVIAGTASTVAGRVNRRQQQKWASQDQAAYEQQQAAQQPAYQQPAPPPPAAESTDQKIAQLKELAQLRDSGVLTEAEFDAQKAKILG